MLPAQMRQGGRRLLAHLFAPQPLRTLEAAAGDAASVSSSGAAYGGLLGQLRWAAARAGATTPGAPVRGKQISLMDNYKQLSKWKLSWLVVLTAGGGYAAGSAETINWEGLLWTSLGTFGAAACANTLNQIYEVSNDQMMSRTCNRPLPAGRLSRAHALGFALTAGAAGLAILYHQANPLTATLGAANIALYAGVYTPLKQMSPINTWIGAVVGAIPPLMGWASASGELEAGAAVLAAALFSWQMPHFMALAWMCKDDYIRGGFRMLSSIDPAGRRTAMVALRHCALLAPLGLAGSWLGVTTEAFAYEAAALAAMLAVPAVRFASDPTQKAARTLFKTSLLYLPLLMLGMVVHRQPNQHAPAPVEEVTERLQQAQAALEGAFTGPASAGPLPWMRAAGEQWLGAVQRVFGLGSSAISELKCPSVVHSDDGDGSVVEVQARVTSHSSHRSSSPSSSSGAQEQAEVAEQEQAQAASLGGVEEESSSTGKQQQEQPKRSRWGGWFSSSRS